MKKIFLYSLATCLTSGFIHSAHAVDIDNSYYPFKNGYRATVAAHGITPKNEDFIESARVVSIPLNGVDFRCSYWPSIKSDKLAVLIPGTNASAKSPISGSVAEKLNLMGYNVLMTTSPLHWTFVYSGLRAAAPGYMPEDSKDLYNAIIRVVEKLETEFSYSQKILLGLSMGALNTLFIADIEKNDPQIGFERFISINPPLDIGESMKALDDMYYESLVNLHIEGVKKGLTMADVRKAWRLKILNVLSQRTPEAIMSLSSDEAALAIGEVFKQIAKEVIIVSQRKKDLGILKNKCSFWRMQPCYREAYAIGFEKYFKKFVMTYYKAFSDNPWKANKTAEEAIRESSIYALEDTLANLDSLYILHSADDPLISEKSVNDLKEMIPSERLFMFKYGGHTGFLVDPQFSKIMSTLLATNLDPMASL